MNSHTPVIQVENLGYRYAGVDAVQNLNLQILPGRCYGLFGRNGAGKTTAIKCLVDLLRPQTGQVRLFGLDPVKHELEVKRRLSYVPDQIAFYPWMTVRETLAYLASFRTRWNEKTQRELLERFRLDPSQVMASLSKGQRTQVALIAAVCPETELLVLDEPTSGLDPITRREFIETVIGTYQESGPGNRTIRVATHLIREFEGLIDEFTIMEDGCDLLTDGADTARARFQKIRARFTAIPPTLDLSGAFHVRRLGRDLDLVVNGNGPEMLQQIRTYHPEALITESLTLEEIFVATSNA